MTSASSAARMTSSSGWSAEMAANPAAARLYGRIVQRLAACLLFGLGSPKRRLEDSKTLLIAERSFQRLDAPELLADLTTGVV